MLEILPETEGNLLVVKASQKLTTKDYEEIFIPTLNKLIEQHGKIRILMCLDNSFSGWELGAMWDDAKFGIEHRKDFEKIAVVGGPKWVDWCTKIGGYFMSIDVNTADASGFQKALDWIKA